MRCSNCGAEVQDSFKFCPNCGKPAGSQYCHGCGTQVKPDANFCPNCGSNLKNPGIASATPTTPTPPTIPTIPTGISSDLRDLLPGEAVLKDSGHFPITYVKNMMSSINGKLYLTNQRLVFKASKLQGDAGMFGGDAASKTKEIFSIPLAEIAKIEAGMVTLIIHSGNTYKFGGMRDTKDWAAAINQSSVR
jgi:RNA polymerase subunit RPABC4/transcription elongation factor Spt4